MHSLFGDFRAFWCAGSALLQHADPYASASLVLCERVPAGFGLYSAPANVVVPAPLPPYALLLFVPFAFMPFPLAAALWGLAIVGASGVSVRVIARTLQLPLALNVAMLLLATMVLWLPFGEATPFALLGAALAARALQLKRSAGVAAGLAIMAIEPHLALGAWIAVFIFAPRARLAVTLTGAALLLISNLAHSGALYEYVAAVLPMHAFAEIPRTTQFSATWIAYQAGLSPARALLIGHVTFGCMLVFGIVAARALARRWNEPALLIFIPLACAVVGGTFVHASQIVFATPLAAFLAVHRRGLPRPAAALACAFIAVPWLQGGQQQTIVLIGAVLAIAIVYAATLDSVLTLRAAIASASLAAALVILNRNAAAPHRSAPPALPDSTLASAGWARYIWSEQAAAPAHVWVAKSATWIALLVLVGCVAYALAYEQRVASVRVQQSPAIE